MRKNSRWLLHGLLTLIGVAINAIGLAGLPGDWATWERYLGSLSENQFRLILMVVGTLVVTTVIVSWARWHGRAEKSEPSPEYRKQTFEKSPRAQAMEASPSSIQVGGDVAPHISFHYEGSVKGDPLLESELVADPHGVRLDRRTWVTTDSEGRPLEKHSVWLVVAFHLTNHSESRRQLRPPRPSDAWGIGGAFGEEVKIKWHDCALRVDDTEHTEAVTLGFGESPRISLEFETDFAATIPDWVDSVYLFKIRLRLVGEPTRIIDVTPLYNDFKAQPSTAPVKSGKTAELSWRELLTEFRALKAQDAQVQRTRDGETISWAPVQLYPYSRKEAERFEILADAAGRKEAIRRGEELPGKPRHYWYLTVGRQTSPAAIGTPEHPITHFMVVDLISRSIDFCLDRLGQGAE